MLQLSACVYHILTPNSITDELLPAHDKSPPVCGISDVVHVGARPDLPEPLHYHLPPEAPPD